MRTEISHPDLNPEQERDIYFKEIFSEVNQTEFVTTGRFTLPASLHHSRKHVNSDSICLQRQMFYISFDLELRSLNGKVLVFGSFFEMHSFQEGWKMKELNSSLLSPLSLLLAMLTVTLASSIHWDSTFWIYKKTLRQYTFLLFNVIRYATRSSRW